MLYSKCIYLPLLIWHLLHLTSMHLLGTGLTSPIGNDCFN